MHLAKIDSNSRIIISPKDASLLPNTGGGGFDRMRRLQSTYNPHSISHNSGRGRRDSGFLKILKRNGMLILFARLGDENKSYAANIGLYCCFFLNEPEQILISIFF